VSTVWKTHQKTGLKRLASFFVQKSELQQGNYKNPDTNLTLRQKRLKSQNVSKQSSICDVPRMPTLSWHVKKQKKLFFANGSWFLT